MPKKNKREDEKKSGSVRSQLRQAGMNGNISKRELMQISGSTGKSSAQVIKQLDKLNARKGLTIGLGDAAVRNIMKGAAPSISDSGLGAYGTGKIGTAVANYWKATNAPTQSNNPISGSTNLYGSLNVTPGLKQSLASLAPLQAGGKMQINSAGGYTPKFSNANYSANSLAKALGANTAPAKATGGTTTTGAGSMDTGTASAGGTTVDTTVDSQVTLPGISTALANWAQGFRRKASSRQQAGRKAQGLASAKIAPVTNTLGY